MEAVYRSELAMMKYGQLYLALKSLLATPEDRRPQMVVCWFEGPSDPPVVGACWKSYGLLKRSDPFPGYFPVPGKTDVVFVLDHANEMIVKPAEKGNLTAANVHHVSQLHDQYFALDTFEVKSKDLAKVCSFKYASDDPMSRTKLFSFRANKESKPFVLSNVAIKDADKEFVPTKKGTGGIPFFSRDAAALGEAQNYADKTTYKNFVHFCKTPQYRTLENFQLPFGFALRAVTKRNDSDAIALIVARTAEAVSQFSIALKGDYKTGYSGCGSLENWSATIAQLPAAFPELCKDHKRVAALNAWKCLSHSVGQLVQMPWREASTCADPACRGKGSCCRSPDHWEDWHRALNQDAADIVKLIRRAQKNPATPGEILKDEELGQLVAFARFSQRYWHGHDAMHDTHHNHILPASLIDDHVPYPGPAAVKACQSTWCRDCIVDGTDLPGLFMKPNVFAKAAEDDEKNRRDIMTKLFDGALVCGAEAPRKEEVGRGEGRAP